VRRLEAEKHKKPLIKGFLYGDRKKENGTKLRDVALVTIDVDDAKEADLLHLSVENRFPNGEVFTSQSASGRIKAHFFVDVESYYQADSWMSPANISLAMFKAIGRDESKFDHCGCSQCFLTPSLKSELEGRKHFLWSKEALDELFASIEYRKKPVSPFPSITEKALEASRGYLSGLDVGKSIKTVEQVLAALLMAKTIGYDEGKEQKRLIQESLAITLGVSKMAVSRALVRLGELGLVITKSIGKVRKVNLYTLPMSSHTIAIESSLVGPHVELIGTVLPLVGNTSHQSDTRTLIKKRANDGSAVEGSFNRCEVVVCLEAVKEGWSFAQLVECLSQEWIGWYELRREKRLLGVFKWAQKKIANRTKM
jgi:hypothetical protein